MIYFCFGDLFFVIFVEVWFIFIDLEWKLRLDD